MKNLLHRRFGWLTGLCLAAFSSIPALAESTGPSTAQVPYVEPMASNVSFMSLLTAGDSVGGYRMVGIPDGLGAFDNGDGTYTLVMNHELGSTVGINRAHGGKGAFVSKWVINKTTQQVMSGQDLITNVFLYNTNTLVFEQTAGVSLQRLCSADLPAVTAFYNTNSGKGTLNRIFMSGEEGAPNRAFGHVVNGPDAGKSYHLAYFGRWSFENALANPYMQDKTVVALTDDDGTTDSQVMLYIGNKQTTGNEVEKAGLVGGTLYGVSVNGLAVETAGTTEGVRTFSLVNVSALTNVLQASFDGIEQVSTNAGVSSFQRVEDGAWNPNNPREFYFLTTASTSLPSRLWRLTFTDITQPTLGGTIEMVLNGTEGQLMLDNLCFDAQGNLVLQEDPGNNNRLSRMWKYYPATDGLIALGQAKPTYFTTGQPNFITIDEEHSGVIDMSSILGAGKYLYVTQVHSSAPVAGANQTELVEGGQLALMTITGSAPTVVTQPSPVTISQGQSATFIVTASTGAQIQWYKNGVPLFGATGSSYNIPTPTYAEAGRYVAVVTDVNGSVSSTTVNLNFLDIASYAGLAVAGPVGQQYQIQYATSLQEPVTWTNLEVITLTTSPLLYIDQSSPGKAQRFYRAVPTP